MSKITRARVQVEIPSIPHFIRLTPGGSAPIHLFTEEELRAVERE